MRDPILRLWDGYIVAYARLVSARHALVHARRSGLPPFEVVDVDPDAIEYTVERDGYPSQARPGTVFPGPKFKLAGTVRGGGWDAREVRFEETELYRSFEAHFERGVDWADTPFFRRSLDLIADGVELWGCTDRDAFERRCEAVDALYERIGDEGYRSQRELCADDVEDPLEDPDDSRTVRLVHDELTVCVGREGDLLFLDGRNRLAIAKLLDLDSVPVWILVRHERWQAFREELARNPSLREALPPSLQDHPDLRGILERRGSDPVRST
ncbi:hypothetical protein [Halorarum salinum]|uniref:ParB/Sulfiredoxin domain-containing protein n=1 Tax=Halorarum salinum TaxID=2743089 RepID=A0A7D5LAW7_9EURY|nr:hypothetical protein [Halobaculum salinum]QLG62147.1 hypothetical protein HUG12_10550 [Halobaculum salinum]